MTEPFASDLKRQVVQLRAERDRYKEALARVLRELEHMPADERPLFATRVAREALSTVAADEVTDYVAKVCGRCDRIKSKCTCSDGECG